MLTFTPEAATLVRTLVRKADSPSDAGVRITTDPVHHSLRMMLAPVPEPGDTVLCQQGARLFVAPTAELMVRGGRLHAELSQARALFILDRELSARRWLGPWSLLAGLLAGLLGRSGDPVVAGSGAAAGRA